jgi:hypothetical protein
MENEIKTEDRRLRVCFKTTAKGEVQPDITAEASEPELVKYLLSEGIEILKAATKEHGFAWMGKAIE